MSKNVISRESAEEQIDVLLEYYDLDDDDIGNAEKESGLDMTKHKLIKHIMKGRLEISESEDGLSVIQHLRSGKEDMTYQEICGRHKIQMKNNSQDDWFGKMYSLVGSMTGVGSKAIENLKGVDMSVCECLGAIFLNV